MQARIEDELEKEICQTSEVWVTSQVSAEKETANAVL
jgi:hypothetical protein